MRDVYCETMLEMMREDDRIVELEADLSGAMNTRVIRDAFPERFVNCGIMEAHMAGLACGMSVNGMIPFAHSFATFLSRRVADQVFMSGCYQNANVKLIASDPGICAETNGGTHQAFEDMGILRAMAGMTVLDVADPVLLKKLLPMLRDTYGMFYLRMPRGAATQYYAPENDFAIGKAKLLREGEDVAIIASGICVAEALEAAGALAQEGVRARVVDMFTVKPVDVEIGCGLRAAHRDASSPPRTTISTAALAPPWPRRCVKTRPHRWCAWACATAAARWARRHIWPKRWASQPQTSFAPAKRRWR